MRLGVLDQSPVISGHTPAQAVAETVALAEAADRLGYSRYWLAEHHAIAALADPCPEILLARVASATWRIRVGTGGVLLPYYSPLKVAEVFRMLEALFPGRIDLGIGRAPGGDRSPRRRSRAGTTRSPRISAAGARPGRIPRRRAPRRSSVRAGEGAARGRHRTRGLAARLLRLQRRARRPARPALRVRALHQRARRRRGDARLPEFMPSAREDAPTRSCACS